MTDAPAPPAWKLIREPRSGTALEGLDRAPAVVKLLRAGRHAAYGDVLIDVEAEDAETGTRWRVPRARCIRVSDQFTELHAQGEAQQIS